MGHMLAFVSGRHDPPLPRVPRLRRHLRPELHRHRRQDHRPGGRRGRRLPRRRRSGTSTPTTRPPRALNLKPATLYPYATEHIAEIIAMIETLVEKGHAYAAGGDVYFRVRTKPDYGKLSKRDIDDLHLRRPHRGRRRQRRSARLRALEGGQARRAGVGQPVGPGPSRLAHRVFGDVDEVPGRHARLPRRRRGPHLPAPRERARPERVCDRQAVRPTSGCTTDS